MNIHCKPSTSSIPRKSTLLKSSGVCILCRTNTRRACMASDGSGLLARRVLKHCPSVGSRSRSQPPVGPFTNSMSNVQSSKSKVQSSFSSTTGKSLTTSRTPRVPRPWIPSWTRPYQQSAHIPITPKEFNSFHCH